MYVYIYRLKFQKMLKLFVKLSLLFFCVCKTVTSTFAMQDWSEDFLNSQTTLKPNARVDDPLEYTEAGYPAESRSGLYEHLKLPKGTVVSAYNPCEQEELRENCLISHTFNMKFPKIMTEDMLASHLPKDLTAFVLDHLNIPIENISIYWVTHNQPYKEEIPFLVRPHHGIFPNIPSRSKNPHFEKKVVTVGIFNPDPDVTVDNIHKKNEWDITLD